MMQDRFHRHGDRKVRQEVVLVVVQALVIVVPIEAETLAKLVGEDLLDIGELHTFREARLGSALGRPLVGGDFSQIHGSQS